MPYDEGAVNEWIDSLVEKMVDDIAHRVASQLQQHTTVQQQALLVDPAEAAKLLSISRSKLYELLAFAFFAIIHCRFPC